MSITKTAKSRYLSQPAVSKTISELEESIQVKLFNRMNGKLQLNEEGKQFRIKANQLLKDYSELENFNHTFDERIPLRIGVSLTISYYALPDAIKRFRKRYPHTPLKIYSENADRVQERLRNGEIDLAFTEGFESNYEFDSKQLSVYPVHLVSSSKSLFTNEIITNYKDLLELPMLLREKGSTPR